MQKNIYIATFKIALCMMLNVITKEYVPRYMKMYHKSGFELSCHAKPAKWAEHLAENPIKIGW